MRFIFILFFTSCYFFLFSQEKEIVSSLDSIVTIEIFYNNKKDILKIVIDDFIFTSNREIDVCDCGLFEELVDECFVLDLPKIEKISKLNDSLYFISASLYISPLFINHIWIYNIKNKQFVEKIAFFSFRKVVDIFELYKNKEIIIETFPIYRLNYYNDCFERLYKFEYIDY